MSELKLARLPDRKPVKIAITVSPNLNKKLDAYAAAYVAQEVEQSAGVADHFIAQGRHGGGG